VIQRRLQDPLAQMLLEGKIGDGDTITVGAGKSGLVINGQEFASPEDDVATDRAPSKALH
jgi:ATP-dependent Clp protease ATP-binding subunit ClpB